MDSSASTNGAVIDTDPVVRQVRKALAAADEAGKARPGRPTLRKLTGATDHKLKGVLATLAAEMPPPAVEVAAEPTPEPEPQRPETPEPAPVASPPAVPPAAAKTPSRWPLVVIGLGAAVAVWSGWVGLGELTGFGVIRPLPGIINGFQINTAVFLPISVEAYAAYALRIWLGDPRSERTRTFARRSSVASLAIGAAAQGGYHLMAAAHIHTAPWPVTVLVACVPVLVLGLASALARLVANDTRKD